MNKNRLEELREANDLSKKEIAGILGVSDSIYARWENGKDIIPTRRLYALANYYKINIDYLLGLTNNKIEIIADKDIDLTKVSQNLREIRQRFDESLRKFSQRLNTSNSTWSAYETGKVLILCAFLIQVCQFSNYSADWILGRSTKKDRS